MLILKFMNHLLVHETRCYKPFCLHSGKNINITCETILSLILSPKVVPGRMRPLLSRYEALFDLAPVGYIILNANYIILDVNPFCARLLGPDPKLIIGQVFRRFVSDESWPVFSAGLIANTPLSENKEFELTLKTVDGTLLSAQANVLSLVNPDEYIISILDMTYRRQTDDRMQGLTQKLRDLSAHIEAGMEQEKKRIAREIHDGLGSALSALKMELSLLRRRLEPGNSDPEIEKQIRSMSALVEGTVDLVRKLATELRPEVLDELGLIATLRWYTRDFGERAGFTSGFTVYPKDFKLDPALSTAIFRIFQEIMNNVAKHSAAGRVTVFLRKQQHQFLMRVRDDGIGIHEEELNHKRSFGIIGMQERVKLLKGQMKITGIKGKGTTVLLEIPIQTNS